VEKTIKKGGYDDDDEAKKLGRQSKDQPDEPARELTQEEILRRKIARQPEELANYFELAQLYINNEDYQQAEEVFAEALEASNGDPDVRERWEDAQLRHLRQRITRTEDEETRKKLRQEFIAKELELYKNRSERYPSNLGVKYELGLRYQLSGQYNEAIKEFQRAREDPRRKGLCMLALGQCFEKVRQYPLSMSHYEKAIEEIPDRDAQHKKEALYQAGNLALHLKNLDTAEKHLTTLAGLDFTFKDVSELLGKIDDLRRGD
jgi:tetratricopeptide (TPR) repeat protein